MTKLEVEQHELADGGPLADDAWTAVVAKDASDPVNARGEAGVQQMDEGLWGVWGWNPDTRQTFLNSTHDTQREALEAARAFVVSKVALATLPGPAGLGEAEMDDEAELAHRDGHDFDPSGCPSCQRELVEDHRGGHSDPRCWACHLEADEAKADCSRRDGPDCVGHSPWAHNDQLWAEAVEAVEAEVEVELDDGTTVVVDPDVAELVEAGWSVGEAELLADHHDGNHDEAVPGCPQCDELMDDDPADDGGVVVVSREAVEARFSPATVEAYDPVAHIALVRETQTWSVWAVIPEARGLWVGNPTRFEARERARQLFVELSYTHGEEGSRSEAIVRASEAQLDRPLEDRQPNPHTGGIPLTVDEVIALVAIGQADGPEGVLMAWQAISDCPDDDDHDPDTGECICWAGVNQEPDDVAEAESDPMGFGELRSWLECEAPFELWS